MNILVIGSGGREHALAWKLSQSPRAEKLYAVPGNPGMAEVATCVSGLSIIDNEALVRFAKEHAIDLVVVGPEVPLTGGIVDAMTEAGIKAFGPTKLAAEVEGSKSFSKHVMQKYGIPTAAYAVFTDVEKARAYVEEQGAPIVIKADGLAAGKGVIVAETKEQALEAVDAILKDAAFGAAGSSVVIEEFMEGEEASLLAFTDGETVRPMISAQDHKRAYDGDRGPNTGGMGTYATAPVMTKELVDEVMERILRPMVRALKEEGRTYKGCLYAGLMITKDGPKVVEFNARFGDPETQVVIPLLQGDLVEIMLACVDGTLDQVDFSWEQGAAVCVVMASGGYPGAYKKGFEIDGIKKAESLGTFVFHAGTAEKDGKLVTAGGRVLGVVAKGEDIKAAVERAYKGVEAISFAGEFHRNDIAHRALERIKD